MDNIDDNDGDNDDEDNDEKEDKTMVFIDLGWSLTLTNAIVNKFEGIIIKIITMTITIAINLSIVAGFRLLLRPPIKIVRRRASLARRIPNCRLFD